MNMLTVEQVAEKWGLSKRTIQNFCKNGKIPGTINFGKSWMIPADAVRPVDGRYKKVAVVDQKELELNAQNKIKQQKFIEAKPTVLRQSPFLDMTDLYSEPGTADQCVQKLKDFPKTQQIFAMEIAYSRGQIDQVYKYANELLKNQNGLYEVISSSMLLALCAMWKGDVKMWYRAKKHMYEAPCKDDADRDIVALALASTDSAIRNTKDFPEWFMRGCFYKLPREAHPAARVYYIKHLMIAAQEMAIGNLELDDISGLGLMKTLPYIMEPMISTMVVDKIVMAEIYLRLLCAMAYHQTGDDERGGEHLDKAIRLCLADGFYGPLVEHRRQLGLFLDEHLGMIDQKALKKVKELHRELHSGWTVIHNEVTDRAVSVNLTIREREIARLAAFGLSDSQISQQLGISESAVKVMIRSAKTKTNVTKRSELALLI